MTTEKWTITATPPTPNGDLHLGHLSGPYLAADILKRRLTSIGNSVASITGIDVNQTYTDAEAIRSSTKPYQVVKVHEANIIRAWREYDMGFDVIGRPSVDAYHTDTTRKMFSELLGNGHILARTTPLPYCPSCERWSFEAYVAGSCPHCGSSSCGNACEVCCLPNDCHDLGDPKCTICGAACQLRKCERFYLPLEPHRQFLLEYWGRTEMSPRLRALCKQMSSGRLPDICVSHPSEWGIRVPIEGFAEQAVYVWFEMAAGYLAAGATPESESAPWSREARIVQCFGMDNGYFHAVLFPAVMRAYRSETALPSAFVTNEFLRLDGLKFSTSRKHAIWALDALKDDEADRIRLYLAWVCPSSAQTNFTREGMAGFLNGTFDPLTKRWMSGFVRRRDLAKSRTGNTGGQQDLWDAEKDALTVACSNLSAQVNWLHIALEEAYSPLGFSPSCALSSMLALACWAARYCDEVEWIIASNPGRANCSGFIAAEERAVEAFLFGLYPIAPVTARRFWDGFNICDAPAPWCRNGQSVIDEATTSPEPLSTESVPLGETV